MIYAFFRRDAVQTSSYKLNFIFSIISMFLWSLTMGTLGKVTQSAQAPYMEKYGNMSASSFLIIGMMCNLFLQESLFAPRWIANPGRIERIMLTPCSIPVFILGTMSWHYFWNALNLVVFISVGATLFGLNLYGVDWATFLFVLLLGIVAMWGLGIISAAIQLVTKRWDPVSWVFSTFSWFLSGVLYSPEALLMVDATGFLYAVSWCFPQTYVYHMIRLAFVGESLLGILSPLVNLIIMAAIFFGLGWLTFKLCLRRCQLEGSLGWV